MRFLNPTTDITFKKIFGDSRRKDIIIGFLNDILERQPGSKITGVTILDPNNYSEISSAKSSIVDIRCVDEKKCNYIVEMQMMHQPGFLERCQYYTSIEVSRQLDKGELYPTLTPVIFVGITNFNLFKHDRYVSHHLLLDTKTHVQYLNLTQYHFLELAKFNKDIDDLSSVIDQWAYFLKKAGTIDEIPESLQQRSEFVRAFEVLETRQFTKQELATYEKEIDYYRLERERIEGAEQRGIETGIKIGIEKGKNEGIEIGLKKGKEDGLKKVALEMLLDGMDIKKVSKITGLSVETVAALKNLKEANSGTMREQHQ